MDRDEILKYLNTLPTDKLNQLKEYSTLMLLPDSSTLLNINQPQLVDKAMQLADVFFPEWTDRSSSDFGKFLIEIFALFSEKDFKYINHYANEGFLLTTQYFSNAYFKALEYGYTPKTIVLPTVKPILYFDSGEDVVVPKGGIEFEFSLFKGTLASPTDKLTKIYTNIKSFTISQAAPGSTTAISNVLFKEGTLIEKTLSYNNRPIKLYDKNIDMSTIDVSINGVVYTKVSTFGSKSPDLKAFLPIPEEDGSVTIYLGDRVFFTNPPYGAQVSISYLNSPNFTSTFDYSDYFTQISVKKPVLGRTISKYEGINPTEFIQFSNPSAFIAYANASLILTGGHYLQGQLQDSLTKVKQKSILWYKTSYRLINITDIKQYLSIELEYPKSSVSMYANKLLVSAYKSNKSNSYIQDELSTTLLPRVMMGIDYIYVPTTKITLTQFEAFIYVTKGLSNLSDIANKAYAEFAALNDPEISSDYAKQFSVSEFTIRCISRIQGVSNVTVVSVNGQVPSTVNKGLFPQVVKNNEILVLPTPTAPTITTSASGIIFISGIVTLNVFYQE